MRPDVEDAKCPRCARSIALDLLAEQAAIAREWKRRALIAEHEVRRLEQQLRCSERSRC